MDFQRALDLFKNDKIGDLAQDADGLRFLKLRSLSRKDFLDTLFAAAGIVPLSSRGTEMFRQAFATPISMDIIERVVRLIYEAERAVRRTGEPGLVSELYKLECFDWGGLYQNSLEKTIVDNYVKKTKSYEALENKIENELHNSMRGFVLCQWYNHWTSIIIEDIFRDHPSVLPAVGQVKMIDFFVRDVPFDLKVTYFPEGYIKDRRREANLKPELTLLKQCARAHDVHFDATLPEAKLLEDLWKKHRDHPSHESRSLVKGLLDYRLALLAESKEDMTRLVRWLYENQGIRRFDCSNRIFLVLVDTSDFFASWKLKRARPLIAQKVNEYLDGLDSPPGQTVDFDWDGAACRALGEAIFVELS